MDTTQSCFSPCCLGSCVQLHLLCSLHHLVWLLTSTPGQDCAAAPLVLVPPLQAAQVRRCIIS